MTALNALLGYRTHPVLANIVTRGAGLCSLLVTTLILARLGGPGAVGVFALLRLLPSLAGVVVSGGLSGAIAFFLAGPARQDARLRSTLPAMALTSGLLGTMIWIAASPLLAKSLFSGLASGLVALAGVRILTYLVNSTARGCLQGMEDLTGCNVAFLMEDLMFLPFFLVLQVGQVPLSAAMVTGLILSDLSINLFAWIRLARRHFFALRGRPSLRLAASIWSFGVRSGLSNLLLLLNLRFDVVMIGFLGGAAPLGTYAVASRYAELLRLSPVAVSFVLVPRYSRLGAVSSTAQARQMLPRAGLLTLAGAIPLALGAFLLPLVYGPDFRSAILPAQIILVGLAGEGFSGVLSAYLYGAGRPGLNSISMAAGVIATVGLDLLLIPRFGALGAAVASSAAYLTVLLVLALCFWKVTRSVEQSDLGVEGRAARSGAA